MKHLAQLNTSKLLKPIDHPQISEFRDNIDRINELAENSKGFVWRLKDEYGSALNIHAFNDPLIVVNMSVWETVEDLRNYVFNSAHVDILRKRNDWFDKQAARNLVMWWIDEGQIPTIDEAKERLNYLLKNGESDYAFTFKSIR